MSEEEIANTIRHLFRFTDNITQYNLEAQLNNWLDASKEKEELIAECERLQGKIKDLQVCCPNCGANLQ